MEVKMVVIGRNGLLLLVTRLLEQAPNRKWVEIVVDRAMNAKQISI